MDTCQEMMLIVEKYAVEHRQHGILNLNGVTKEAQELLYVFMIIFVAMEINCDWDNKGAKRLRQNKQFSIGSVRTTTTYLKY